MRELEARQADLVSQVRAIEKPPHIVPNIERLVIGRIEQLAKTALDPDHGERVRVVAPDLIGSVRVVEEGEHIIAEIDGGRC